MGKEWEGRGGVTGRHRTEVSRRAAASVSRVSTKDFFFLLVLWSVVLSCSRVCYAGYRTGYICVGVLGILYILLAQARESR